MMKRIAILFLAGLAPQLHAQFEEDPRQKMKEILEQVAEEMTQIDKWLLETNRGSDAGEGMVRNVERLNKLLEQVGDSQSKVIKGIDDLLEEAQKMQGKGSGSPQSSQDGDKPGDSDGKPPGRDQGGGLQRRELRPDQIVQPPSEGGEKGGSQERNDRQEWEKGQNKPSDARPDDATEKADAAKTGGAWGDLPPYVLKHGRGTMPEVPEKYRRYLEAITTGGNKHK